MVKGKKGKKGKKKTVTAEVDPEFQPFIPMPEYEAHKKTKKGLKSTIRQLKAASAPSTKKKKTTKKKKSAKKKKKRRKLTPRRTLKMRAKCRSCERMMKTKGFKITRPAGWPTRKRKAKLVAK